MKYLIILIFNLTLIVNLQGQTLVESVMLHACACLDSVETYEVLKDSIQPSIVSGLTKAVIEGKYENEGVGTVEAIRGTIKSAQENLPSYCYNVRRLIIGEKAKQFYKRSDNPKANEYFDKGNNFLAKKNYKKAIKAFKSALKEDEQFVFAIDHLAVSYRQLEKYKMAIKYYKESLDIFPEGDLALLNMAVAYSLLGDNDNSIKTYKNLRFFYRDNPEGYFGLAKTLFLKGDHGDALDNLFTAHRMYIDSNSDYKEDSEKLLHLMFLTLKELDKLDLLMQKAKEYNVEIKEH